MSVQGNFPIAQFPTLPYRQTTTQEQVSGASGIANRTINSPQDFLTVTAGGVSVVINPSMMAPGNVMETLKGAGIAASLDYFGRLRLPDAASVTGNATLLISLGLQSP